VLEHGSKRALVTVPRDPKVVVQNKQVGVASRLLKRCDCPPVKTKRLCEDQFCRSWLAGDLAVLNRRVEPLLRWLLVILERLVVRRAD
jgi:hypothetical protein